MNNHQQHSFHVFGDFEGIDSSSNPHSTSDERRIMISKILFKYLVIWNNFDPFEIDVQHEMHDE